MVLDTLGAVARGGAQTLTWLAVVAVLFFVPAGLVIAELGAAFPNQGGPYVWARLAFGRYAGSLVALIYLLETPVWVGGSLAITAVAVADRLLVSVDGAWRVVVALAFVWTTVALAALPLRAGKRVPLAGAAAQVALLGFFTATLAAGVAATLTTLAAFAVAGDDNGRYFSAALTLSIALLALANLVVFPALVRLRRTQPDQPRPFRVPGGPAGALVAATLATGWSALALAAALWPGLGTGNPDAHLSDGFAGDRLGFTLAELVPLAAVLAAPSLLARRTGPAPSDAAQAPPGLGR